MMWRITVDKISHQRHVLSRLGRDPANPGTVNLGGRIIGTNEGSAVVFVISFVRPLLFKTICLYMKSQIRGSKRPINQPVCPSQRIHFLKASFKLIYLFSCLKRRTFFIFMCQSSLLICSMTVIAKCFLWRFRINCRNKYWFSFTVQSKTA